MFKSFRRNCREKNSPRIIRRLRWKPVLERFVAELTSVDIENGNNNIERFLLSGKGRRTLERIIFSSSQDSPLSIPHRRIFIGIEEKGSF